MNEASRWEAKQALGSQIWLEPEDSADRVDRLFQLAAESGLGWARIFLMWPFIEPEPNRWEFAVFDYAFDAAERYGIRIKATLTANSGPWHIGTPSMLHSNTGFLDEGQREPMARYIAKCVKRYKDHPALGQWILWNEPTAGRDRTPESLKHWHSWLNHRYGGDLSALNKRWMTGYGSFADIPFPEQVPHPVHRHNHWNNYGPWLDDWQNRAAWLNSELEWVLEQVKAWDAHTETCVNPQPLLSNQAECGIDLERMGTVVDVIGASYHPAWMFTFADRRDFPALMAAGVKLQFSYPTVNRGEVTEVQTGNTLNSSTRPSAADPSEVARFYLASLAAGAESVTGWCFNMRSRDFEAGDWALLDNMDQHSDRSRMMRRIHDKLNDAYRVTGKWHVSKPDACVGFDPRSQAVEWMESRIGAGVAGRLGTDGAHGAALLAAQLMRCGIHTGLSRLDHMANSVESGGMIVLSHLVSWDPDEAERLLAYVENGGTLLFDATCGRKNLDAAMNRPWPGGLSGQIGLRALGLQTRPEGYEVSLHHLDAGHWLLARMDVETEPDAGWHAWSEVRFRLDGAPCVWERSWGKGKIIFVNGMLGPTLVHSKSSSDAIRYILHRAGAHIDKPVMPVTNDTIVIPVQADNGSLMVVLFPDILERQGRLVNIKVSHDRYMDLWSGEMLEAECGELCLEGKEGVALLWHQ